MRRLTLMRHGDARWQDPGVPDLERALNRRGTASAQSMARRLLERGLIPELALVSPARRTQETAAILARELALPPRRVLREEALYLASCEDLLTLIRRTGVRVGHLLVVGHNPGVSELMQLMVPNIAGGGLGAAALCSIGFECEDWGGVAPAAVREVLRESPPSRLLGFLG